MKQKNDTSLSQFLSFLLRHKPETIGLTVQTKGGWANIDELITKSRAHGTAINRETLERIVREDRKQRYSISPDGKYIRANQGHSIDVELEMEERIPPAELYHGTAARFLESIRQNGIKRMSRNYVHLSGDIPTACKVGERHGKPVVLVIDAARMAADGYLFQISANGVWQSADIPWQYVKDVVYPDTDSKN
ncbi:MAG: RNA 2'-phosphotransferase [Oscillospiraceae bacterium]|nr:RNA 2'-phosphotransferase [Oscillospiraceae bacterium]